LKLQPAVRFTHWAACVIFHSKNLTSRFSHRPLREKWTGAQTMIADFRTGMGFDFHRLVEGRDLILGGVQIPHEKGLLGHSDADVLVHAVCDALLGAAGLGDIGIHFPDSDAAYRGISSLELLRRTCQLLDLNGFRIVNVDAVVLAEAPKVMPFRNEIRTRVLQAMAASPPPVFNLKATTTEGCGAVGRGEGIGAMATALIERRAPEGGGAA
jgi:2-C-methyl-D-erythritol 2,4-cyclodiphosphate synthase